jgi:hypothetical protein
VPPHRNLGSFIYMKNETELKPKGIFFKMDWDEMIMDLEDESVGKMIKNAYNYLNDRELIEMDKMESKLFKHVIIPVLNFNNEKYQKQVEHNRRVAPKGGRKPKTEETQTNPMGIIETQNIPSGSFTNPENPKDKDKVKERDIEKDKTRTRLEIEKMKKLVDIDLKTIKVEEEIDFSINVKELVRILNWSRFELLIFYTSVKDVGGLLTEYDKPGCLQGILGIKEHYSYFLDTIIK